MEEGFCVGDKVRKMGNKCQSAHPGEEYVLVSDPKDGGSLGCGRDPQDLCHCQNEWRLVEKAGAVIKSGSNKTMTSIIDKVKLALKTEPNKTLITRGLMTIEEKLTPEGRELLDYVLVQKHGEEMAKIISSVPVEEKK